jgi:hypothetical protein
MLHDASIFQILRNNKQATIIICALVLLVYSFITKSCPQCVMIRFIVLPLLLLLLSSNASAFCPGKTKVSEGRFFLVEPRSFKHAKATVVPSTSRL